jgi:hypothetical protein
MARHHQERVARLYHSPITNRAIRCAIRGNANIGADVTRDAVGWSRPIRRHNRFASYETNPRGANHNPLLCEERAEGLEFPMIVEIREVENQPLTRPFDHDHSLPDARRAPSTSALSFLNEIPASIFPIPAKVPNPQSVPAITRSRPTICAN